MGHIYIGEDVKKLILHMSYQPNMTAKKIRKLTGVSKRAQQHIHKNFRNYGTVVKKPLVAGQRHLLTGLEITVCQLNPHL